MDIYIKLSFAMILNILFAEQKYKLSLTGKST